MLIFIIGIIFLQILTANIICDPTIISTIASNTTKNVSNNTTTSTSSKTSTLTSTTTESTTTTQAQIPPGATEVNCIFPFIYNGNWTDQCVESKETPQTYWCSLDKIFNNRSVPCEQRCPLLARQLMVNDASQTHTTCLNPSPQSSSLFPDKEQIDIILAEHNRVRSEVDPPAADMRVVYWDYGLARLAQRWAENCVFDHDCSECHTLLNNQSISVGQNAYAYFGSEYNPKTFWLDVLKLWEDEKKNFKYELGAVTGNFGDIGHYTQLINSDFARVGCGAAMCDSSTFYAYCNYANGQSDINKPYINGSSCSMCPSSSCSQNLCVCEAFCQNSATLDLATCKCNCPTSYSGAQCEIKSEQKILINS